MSDPKPAKLAYLTNPEKGQVLLNIQPEGEEARRFSINRDQLFCLNKDTADILLKDFK